MITLKFQYNNLEPEVAQQIFEAINNNQIFGLQNIKGRIIIFIPKHNAVIYPPSPNTYFNLNHTKQVCNDRKAFENVISMSLYRYKTFIPLPQQLPYEIQKLLSA